MAVRAGAVTIGTGHPLAFIVGPCVIESDGARARDCAPALSDIAARARRAVHLQGVVRQGQSHVAVVVSRPGLDAGLETLAEVEDATGLPVLTDIHEPSHAAPAAEVVDVLQIPAFLCRQTDLLVAAAQTGKTVNVKKGQFLAPRDMRHVVGKLEARARAASCSPNAARRSATTTSSSTCAALPMMRELGRPVVFDVTHSLQLPGAGDGVTGGLAEYIEPLARAGVAAGVDAVFMEVHEQPSRAKSDAANALPLDRARAACCATWSSLIGSPRRMPDLSLARRVLQTEAAAVLALADRLDERFARAVALVRDCKGHVILTGMGKSGIDLPEDRRDAVEHRHVGVLPPPGRSPARRPRRHPRRRRRDRPVVQRRERRAGAGFSRR